MSADLKQRVAAICHALPGAELSTPFGEGYDSWKVGGRIFAQLGATTPGAAVKCASVEMAEMLRDTGRAGRAPYFHRSWVLLPDAVEEDELRHRLLASYDLIRGALPAGLRRALPPRMGEG